MRYKSAGWMVMGAWLGTWPLAAHADYLSNARTAMQKGDLKSAQIELRNAVRADPQNAEAHYFLGRVAMELGDPIAAEREAMAARERGFDPAQSAQLLAQSLTAQRKFDRILEILKPDGKNPRVDASILVYRGYALAELKRVEDAQAAFAEAGKLAPDAVEPLLAEARIAAARADLDTAQAKIDRAIAAQPKSVEALMAKAQLLRLRNDTAGSLAVLNGLVADQPSAMQARLERASLALALGKSDVARSDIDIVLKATPGNINAIYLLAVVETQAKNYKVADANLEKIAPYISRIPRAFYLQAVVKEQLGQLEQAEDSARKYLQRSPNDLIAYKVLARIQFAKRRPDSVIETLSRVADAGKGDAEAYDLLGRAYAAANRPADAIKAYQQAEALAPNDVGLQTRLASVRMGMGDADAAMGDLEHTLELSPKLPAVGEALFYAALATGDPKKTTDALAKIRAAQGDTDVVGNLEGLFKMSQVDLAGAQAVFAQVLKKSPDFTPAKINLARIQTMQGQTAEAEKSLTDILAKQPASEPALSMLASAYVQSGRLPQAIALLERAVKAEPANMRIRAALGDTYIKAGSAQKALDLATPEKGQTIVGVEMRALRASAQLSLGQKKEAITTYTELLKQDPNILGARRQLVALLIDAGDFESARSMINAGIAASPRTYQLYQDLVTIDLRSTGVEAALATADRLAAQDRDFTAIRALRGDTYLAANRPLDAITAYEDAFKTAPSSMLMLRIVGAELRAAKVQDAVKRLTDWIGLHPDDLRAAEQLAEVHIALSQYPEAARWLEEILKTKPNDAVALNNLAWVYQQQGDDRAATLARRAYTLSPGPQTADTLGWILATSGKLETGMPLLRMASMEAVNDPRVQYHYAVALKDSGKRDDAIKKLNEVIAVKGDFKEKQEAQALLDQLKKGT